MFYERVNMTTGELSCSPIGSLCPVSGPIGIAELSCGSLMFSLFYAAFLLGLFFGSKDGGATFLRNVC
jgi:hypothetical protein